VTLASQADKTLTLQTARGVVSFGGRMQIMGIVNATPDSFSDGGTPRSLEDRVGMAAAQLEAGAQVIDVGGESGVTNRPPVPAEEEIARVVPLIQRVAGELGAMVSVDTYKPAVARAAIAAGAAIVNDVSALRDPELADVCAQTGAGLVIMHTRAKPKQKLLDRSYDGRMLADVKQLLAERIDAALARGVMLEQLMIDPGPDFGKTPAQTVEVLRGLSELHEFGRPILLAISRKDFIGAVTGRRPAERLAGTLAALAHGADHGAHMVRVHDVAAAHEFLAVRAVLAGEERLDAEARLADRMRWESQGSATTSWAPGNLSR
jgi:dihydropteroate synthase